jgi:hypothetical protein
MTLLLPFSHEATEVHTRILRIALGVAESRAYWEHVDTRVPVLQRAAVAVDKQWFPGKSVARVRYLIAACAERYDAFPEGLEALRRWRTIDDTSAKVACHVHVMLSDPLYRAFAGELLPARRAARAGLPRDVVTRWVEEHAPGRWAGVTAQQAAQKLLAAAHEAGLVGAREPRELLPLAVPDLAIAYVLQLLRGVRFEGEPLDNVYLRSLGLGGSGVGGSGAGGSGAGGTGRWEGLRALGPLGVRLQPDGTVTYADPDVVAWARHTFAPVVG